jgi:hypothetical protein
MVDLASPFLAKIMIASNPATCDDDNDDVYLYKLQTKGVEKSAPYVSI